MTATEKTTIRYQCEKCGELIGSEAHRAACIPTEKTTLHLPGRTAFNPLNLTPAQIGDGWYLLAEGEPLKEGDGFMPPDSFPYWIDYVCRPAIFRGGGEEGSWYHVPQNDTVHTWPWRREIATQADNDAETLMAECLEHEAKQREEIARTPVRADAGSALLALTMAGEALMEYWQHGTPVHAGSDVAADFKAAMEKAHAAIV